MEQGRGRRSDEHGATAAEYAIMAGLVAVVIVMAVFTLGRTVASDYACVGGYVSNPASAPNPTTC